MCTAAPPLPAADAGEGPAGPLTRWFLALRPGARARTRLQQLGERLAARCGGRVVPAARVHLTLVFVGNAPRTLEPALRAVVQALPPPQPLVLERLGSFDGRLLWLAPSAPTEWLDATAGQARDALDRLGIRFDRKPFVAHLTLIRQARPTRGEALAAIGAGLAPVALGHATLHLVESFHDARGLQYRFA